MACLIGYSVGLVFYNEENIYLIRNAKNLQLFIFPNYQIKSVNENNKIVKNDSNEELPICPNALWLNNDQIENECESLFNQLPFKEDLKQKNNMEGFVKTLHLMKSIVTSEIDIITVLNSTARSLPSLIDLTIPIHFLFPDKYQASIYPYALEYVRKYGGTVHTWERISENTYNDCIETFVSNLLLPRTNGGILNIISPSEISTTKTTFPQQLIPQQLNPFGKKSVVYHLPRITMKNHYNISVTFKPKGNERKSILFMQLIYRDTLQSNNTLYQMTSIETIKFSLAQNIVDYYNSLNLGGTLQSFFYDLPEVLKVKNYLKECNDILQLQHPMFHTFLRMANYIINSPLYSKTNMHIASIYHHQLFDFDPLYLTSIYNPVLYTFKTESDAPQAEYSFLKKEVLKQLNVFACIFIQFNRIFVIIREKEKYVEGSEIYKFVQQLKYQSYLPMIPSEMILRFTGGDLLDYSFLDDNPNATFESFLNELSRQMIK